MKIESRVGVRATCFGKLAFLLGLCVGVFGNFFYVRVEGAAAEAKARPNIILIMSDDMGYSDLGCYGGEIQTPNLDKLATGGLRFTQFYNGARCCPTRASLLTGLYPHMAGVGHMGENHGSLFPGYTGSLNQECRTIAEVLRGAGYGTYMVGKWHVAHPGTLNSPNDNWPMQRGFDQFYGTITGAGSFYDPATLCRGNKFITPENDSEYRPKSFYYTDALTDNAINFVRRHQSESAGKPFFLYVSYTAAHWPLHAKPEDIARYRGKYQAGYDAIRAARIEKMKKLGLIDPRWKPSATVGDWSKVEHQSWEERCMEVYAAMVDCMDQNIGRLIDQLDSQGQLDNTLVFFLQDNGACAEPMGRSASKLPDELKPMGPDDLQPKIWPPMQTRDGRPVRSGPEAMPGSADTYVGYGQNWANVSATPFRLYKHWVHEGGISTPLIVHWPRGVATRLRNSLVKDPSNLIDIMATCVDVAGAKYPGVPDSGKIHPLSGISLRPTFAGKSLVRPEPIFWEHEGNRAVRDGKWKLVAKSPTGPWELYDMEADRTEMHDLAGRETKRVSAMIAQWEKWARTHRVLPWISTPAYGDAGKKVFNLKERDTLTKEESPALVRRGFTISAAIETEGADGVIVSQGGARHGFSVFIEKGHLAMALRRDGELTVVQASEKLPEGKVEVVAQLERDGAMVLKMGGKVVATGKAPGVLENMPGDGLQVGRDTGGTVGSYQSPNKFSGKITSLRLELD